MKRYTLIGADRRRRISQSGPAPSEVIARPGSTGAWTAPRRCVPSTAAVTPGIACSSPTKPPPSRPATGPAPGACPTDTASGRSALTPTQNDHVVGESSDLAVGSDGLPLDGSHPDLFPFGITEVQRVDRPPRRWGIRGHDPASTPTAGRRRGPQSSAARRGRPRRQPIAAPGPGPTGRWNAGTAPTPGRMLPTGKLSDRSCC